MDIFHNLLRKIAKAFDLHTRIDRGYLFGWLDSFSEVVGRSLRADFDDIENLLKNRI